MEPAFLAQPVFSPRAVSPLHFEHFEPLPEDVIVPGSSDEDSQGTRIRKRQRRERIGYQYLKGETGFAITVKLKGPFDRGWNNPWKEHGVVVGDEEMDEMRSRKQRVGHGGVRASSPIDLTSHGEEDNDQGQNHGPFRLKRKPIRLDKNWLASNVDRFGKEPNRNNTSASPTPKRGSKLGQRTTFTSKQPDRNKAPSTAVVHTVSSTHPGVVEAEMNGQQHSGTRTAMLGDGLADKPVEKKRVPTVQKSIVEEDEEEEQAELQNGLHDESPGRPPSPELEYSFISERIALERKMSGEESDNQRLDPKLPVTKARLEKRALAKRLEEVRSLLASQHLEADRIEILTLEKEVLEERTASLRATIAAITSAGGSGLLTVKTKRAREQDEPNTNGKPKRLRLSGDESSGSRLERQSEGKGKLVEQGTQVELDQGLLLMAGIRTESSEISHSTSFRSNETERSVKAIGRARRKKNHRHRKALKKLAQEQEKTEKVAQAKRANNALTGLASMVPLLQEVIPQSESTQTKLRPLWTFSSGSEDDDIIMEPATTVQRVEKTSLSEVPINHKVGDCEGNVSMKISRQFICSDPHDGILQPQQRLDIVAAEEPTTGEMPTENAQKKKLPHKKYKSTSLMIEVEVVDELKDHEVRPQVKSIDSKPIGTKGEQVPLMIIEDHDSPTSFPRRSSDVTSPSGWKPYKMPLGGQAYTERVLKEHLASIEAGGPSIDPSKISAQYPSAEARERDVQQTRLEPGMSSQDNINDLMDITAPARQRDMQQMKPAATTPSQNNIIDLTDHDMPDADTEQGKTKMPVKASNLPGQDNAGILQECSRLNTVDSVNTCWQKDQSKIFDVGVNSGSNKRSSAGSKKIRIPKSREEAQTAQAKVPSAKSESITVSLTTQGLNKPKARGTSGTLVRKHMELSGDGELEGRTHKNRRRAQVSSSLDPTTLPPTIAPEAQTTASGVTTEAQQPLVSVVEKALATENPTMAVESSASKKLVSDATLKQQDKKDLTEAQRKSQERLLHTVKVRDARASIRNLIKSGRRSTCGSPHIVPASTNLSLFPYNRVGSRSRPNSSDGVTPNKHEPITPVVAKPLAKRRLSFTPNGRIKRDVEVRVPPMNSEALEASPTSIEGVQVLSRASFSRPQVPQFDKGQSEGQPLKCNGDVLPEAQPITDKLTFGPSTNLLETDSQSLKFPSTNEDDPSAQFSTQAELAKAQRLFQLDLESPLKASMPGLPRTTSFSSSSTVDGPRRDSPSKAPVQRSRYSYAGALQSPSSSQEVPSTQAMVDAMSPFAMSTVKKPGGFLDALAKPASAIFGYMGWSQSQKADSQVPTKTTDAEVLGQSEFPGVPFEAPADIPSPPSRVRNSILEPAIAFDQPALNMETNDSSDVDSLAYALSQPLESPKPRRRKSSTGARHYVRAHDDESDFESSQQPAGLIRDDCGRWCNVSTQIPPVTPRRMTLRSVSSASQAKSQGQDGQRRSGLEEAIDEAGSFLGEWDIKEEARKLSSGPGKSAVRRSVSGVRNKVLL